MRKLLVCLLFLSLLTGCTPTSSKESSTISISSESKKEIEDTYIKTVIESGNRIVENKEILKSNLEVMNVHDEDWKNDVQNISFEINDAVSDYISSELDLTSSLEDKYKNTKSYFSEAVLTIGAISSDVGNALDTYDIKAFEEIEKRLDQSTQLLLKATKELENERYHEE
ncbi:hypothetical protein V7114_20690 [Neobacillus niacini]|uniref:hypothetical protein n=1 Tax=Neobacillus niacini TaxID=86668 RepID=UPI002FFDEEA9